MKAIETSHLTKYYGKERGIIDLNLSVEQGDFFGYIGPNGAGKSTTIRTLLGLIHPTSGQASILGKDIQKDSLQILSDIGYLPSEAIFYHGMRVKDILKFSADLHHTDCRKEQAELCERLQLDPGRKVDDLSLGNRKKVGIVCALQHKPSLYILDEPTSGLDPLMQKEFFEILKERNQSGATVFLSSHVLSEIQRYCNRAAIIRDGKLLLADTVDRLGHTDAKRVVIKGLKEFEVLPNTRDFSQSEDTISFLYSGKPDQLISALAGKPVQDLSISEPDLDEVFMHYYEKGE